jgi:adenosylcobyric acid synthase
MLGERIENAALEGTGDQQTVEGFGRLPVVTRFSPDKRVAETTVEVCGSGVLSGATGTASGYEIHAGQSEILGPVDQPLGPESAATQNTLGTYLHGLFDNQSVREAFVTTLFERAGRDRPAGQADHVNPYDAAATLVREADGLIAMFDRVR